MGANVNYGGLVIAGIGFFLTRFTVSLAIYQDPLRFYVAGVVPLVLGLGLAAFGVGLAVADAERAFVRTTATWCVIGTVAMLALVVLTLVGSAGAGDAATVRSQTYLSNFLIGGSVGGTLTGLYAAGNRRHRTELGRQANRLEVLNRLLRHEVLNALAVIRGYATLDDEGDRRAVDVIEERARDIERTIEEVKHLTRSTRSGESFGPVDVAAALADAASGVRDRHPEAAISIEPSTGETTARTGEGVERVFAELLENAVVYGDGSARVEVTSTPTAVRVAITDDGGGLPAGQQQLLETGDIGDFDDPSTGFGLNVVRLLVESYAGSIETETGPHGTTVTVVLPRVEADGSAIRPIPSALAGGRPAIPHLTVTLAAAIVAGVAYGLVSEALGGSVGVIGVFYGLANPVVGWITHEFHSVVFGFVFAGLVSLAPTAYRDHVPASVAVGVGWALVLWALAAGVVAPVWLRLLGIPASIPSLSGTILASHLAWGVTLGLLAALGDRHVAPRLSRLVDSRPRRRTGNRPVGLRRD